MQHIKETDPNREKSGVEIECREMIEWNYRQEGEMDNSMENVPEIKK